MAASIYAEDVMRSAATGVTAISAVIGSRVYPLGDVPQTIAEMPFVIYQRTSAPRTHHLTGVSGLVVADIVWSIYGDVYDTVKALADNCRLALDGMRGTKTIAPNSIVIKCCLLTDEKEDSEFPDDKSERRIFRIDQTYQVGWTEATS
jgi:hypothetical protein